MTAARTVVLDASVLVRSLTDPHGQAAAWVSRIRDEKVEGHTPKLAFTEAANALLGYVRAGLFGQDEVASMLETLLLLPLRRHGAELTQAAFSVSVDLGLSAYDGTYAALAEGLDAVLVTADRRLAHAIPDAELVDS